MTGEAGRREPREKSDPPAQQKVPTTSTAIAARSKRPLPRTVPGPARIASPAEPSAIPARTAPRGIRRRRIASINTKDIGSVATTSAATPDGIECSAQTSPPEPQTKSRKPVTAAPPHSRRDGRGVPEASAQTYITTPARKKRTPCVKNGGSVSIEKRMPRYVEPQRT